MYEVHYMSLIKKREEFRKLTRISLRNYKLQSMILSANACGIDLANFVLEKQNESKKAEYKKQDTVLLQNEKQFKCPHCEYVTDNQKKLAGHTKKHSPKYEVVNLKSSLK